MCELLRHRRSHCYVKNIFWLEDNKGRDRLGNVDVDERIILKLVLGKYSEYLNLIELSQDRI